MFGEVKFRPPFRMCLELEEFSYFSRYFVVYQIACGSYPLSAFDSGIEGGVDVENEAEEIEAGRDVKCFSTYSMQ